MAVRNHVGAVLSSASGAGLLPAMAGRLRRLRRLPHVFNKVLELPLAADADVTVEEHSGGFRFVAAAGGVDFDAGGVQVHAVEIHPGVTKVVVAAGGGSLDEFELDRWRFRLPACTRPSLATAAYVGDELVVTIPKDGGSDESDDEEDGEKGEFWGGGRKEDLRGIGRLVTVQ